MRAGGRRISVFDFANERFWQLAILTTAGTVAASTQADAALYYWNRDSAFYGDYEPMPLPQPHRQKPKRSTAKKNPAIEKEAGSKPQGPLIISVSIDQQRVSLYDANGLYAESPVSTGMKGHSTPMGVFSVIQKQKYHQSNIYSGAPMPYMQRITWSGIAMHAGVLPGYPASHGCIRMPMSFAVKMYNWTRMGARVFVTPGTISPESFSHPLLVTQKVAPQQPVADDILKMDAPLGVKSDKGADKQSSLDLRSSVGHAAASLRDNTHTADASSAMPAASASVTMSDASSSTARDAIAEKIAADKSETVKPETAAADKPAETNSAGHDSNATTDDKTVGETTASTDTPKSEVSASDPVKAEAKADEPKADAAKPGVAEAPKIDAPKADASKAADKPAEAAIAADGPDAKKDPARLPGTARIDVPKRAGQIAVFISRKDSKLYVRQNFAPLFEVPVTIAASDRPLGTHVFTAQADKTDTNLLRWSVVTLPTRNVARIDVEERASHRRKVAAAAVAEARPQPVTNSPAEALDRISIPADVMARISEALGTGGSIIVSDLGVNQGETGEGTDFILPLR
ncbi:lipoprotein-anchoring transpeptidase ErfK/SrfK [Bradyrhizobium sp. USDA 4524]|uniref:L,D-transpeptidase family protein n=1 Tax=unclassified Bradyrhizobium TaxID=2631580 RepID=UPI00209D9BAF|nr:MULTISPECIES: L,D-transpeptidase family protein [unclassified Bradyrhizobium]MCP1844919.1 lipoprotein-anchoring transpeptidase ErfK/SrfK [Bradyrhizobium sp. USDA 4538]MCP1905484.1 lipoprotein-anchoring transpeptidase ErfK/SrfK [Bradyrhizobium sp. USDA 4537]MCP1988860.1 lipoprotein-anchoring transpeptidase ErfK/SrfK [Bradyrhizobium sp. USDA 4539]